VPNIQPRGPFPQIIDRRELCAENLRDKTFVRHGKDPVCLIHSVDTTALRFHSETTFQVYRGNDQEAGMEKFTGHQRIEERSIALHKRISELLEKDPQLLDVAFGNLQKAVRVHGDLPVLLAWARILDGTIDEIRAILISPSENARWLRQSSPFAGVLDPRERWKIYEAFSA
jgi:hypothetical protein